MTLALHPRNVFSFSLPQFPRGSRLHFQHGPSRLFFLRSLVSLFFSLSSFALLHCRKIQLPWFHTVAHSFRKNTGVGCGEQVKWNPSQIHRKFRRMNTYEKCSCNHSGMNTYKTKDLKLPRMNTYRKTGGEGLSARLPARGARAVRKSGLSARLPARGARAVRKSGLSARLPARGARAVKKSSGSPRLARRER